MSLLPVRLLRTSLLVASCAAVAACGSMDVSRRIAGSLTPYRVDVVQGNFVSREQVDILRPGMSRQQVREVLGTPLVTSLFHADRWDYVFTIRRQGVEPQSRHLVVFFKGDALERFEGDTMPTEAEFVGTLAGKQREAKVPVLEASEEALQRSARPAASSKPASAPATPAPTTYPPLESAAR